MFNVDLDTVKLSKYRELQIRATNINKEAQSCVNAVMDEFGEQIKDEDFKKRMRMEMREQCSDAASQLGI